MVWWGEGRGEERDQLYLGDVLDTIELEGVPAAADGQGADPNNFAGHLLDLAKSEGVSFAASVRGACQHVQHVFLTAHIATPTFCSPAKTCKGRSAVTSHQRNHARSPARMSTSKKSGPRALPPGCNEGPYPGSEATYPIEDLSAEQLAWLAVLSEHEQPAIGLAVSDQLVEGEISELDHPWTFRGAGLQQFGRAKQSSRPTTRERTEPHRHAHTHGHTRGVNFFNASSCSYARAYYRASRYHAAVRYYL